MVELGIVVVSYNTRQLTLKCLESIFGSKTQAQFEVWLVDNASSDGTVAEGRRLFPQVKIIESKANLGFAGGNNLALKQIKARYALLLNSDTQVQEGAIDRLLDFAKKGDFAIASCRLVNPDGSFQHNGGYLPYFWPLLAWLSGADDLGRLLGTNIPSYHMVGEGYYKENKGSMGSMGSMGGEEGREVGWVGGTVMLIRQDVYAKAGYLDEKIFMYTEDVEFCWRAKKAGFKTGWTGKAEVVHIGGASSASPQLSQWRGEFRGLIYLYNKHFGILSTLGLKIALLTFILIRAAAFTLLGRAKYAKTYLKVLAQI